MIRNISHVGIIVEDMDEAVKKFTKMGFNVSSTRILGKAGLQVAHLSIADQEIELIAYLDASPSFGREVMGNRKGLNHLAFEVENLDDAIEWIEKLGKKLMKGFPTLGSNGRIAFFEPEMNDNLLIELCEAVKDAG